MLMLESSVGVAWRVPAAIPAYARRRPETCRAVGLVMENTWSLTYHQRNTSSRRGPALESRPLRTRSGSMAPARFRPEVRSSEIVGQVLPFAWNVAATA